MEAIEEKKYVFEVAPSANKIEIRKAIETIFGVKVQSVNTVKVQGKTKRMGVHVGKRSDMKKAYIQLTADSKAIELFEGMV
jgi:large subunit ribosomal protein L23